MAESCESCRFLATAQAGESEGIGRPLPAVSAASARTPSLAPDHLSICLVRGVSERIGSRGRLAPYVIREVLGLLVSVPGGVSAGIMEKGE